MASVETSIYASTDAPPEWEAFEIPDENMIEGSFEGQIHWLRQTSGGEGQLMTGVFTGTESKFSYTFAGDETFHVIEGSVTIEVEGGEEVKLGPGSIASFPKGAASIWTVHEPFRKFFVISG
jgi:uncharacterized cupin superfamily protein